MLCFTTYGVHCLTTNTDALALHICATLGKGKNLSLSLSSYKVKIINRYYVQKFQNRIFFQTSSPV